MLVIASRSWAGKNPSFVKQLHPVDNIIMASKTLGEKLSISSLDDKEKQLIQKAIESKVKAHCPYSKYNVGAALITGSGKVYTGQVW